MDLTKVYSSVQSMTYDAFGPLFIICGGLLLHHQGPLPSFSLLWKGGCAPVIDVKNLSKSFGHTHVLKNIQ